MNIGTDWFARFAEAYRVEAAVWLDSFAGPGAIGPSACDGLVAERVVEAAIESLQHPPPGRGGEAAKPPICTASQRSRPPSERVLDLHGASVS